MSYKINKNNHFNNNNIYQINFGPAHPAAHGVLRCILFILGEKILRISTHIGLLHRGTEILSLFKSKNQILPYFDRLDYVSMSMMEYMFVLVLEKILCSKTNLLYSYMRIILNEISRCLSHLMCITTHILDVGAFSPFLWYFEEREM